MAKTKGPRRIWDNHETIGEFMKSASMKVVVQLTAKDGVKYLNIREWYMRKADSVWRPSRNGICVPVMLPVGDTILYSGQDMINIMKEALLKAPNFEIENEANAVYASEEE